jgi:hypothetical protein
MNFHEFYYKISEMPSQFISPSVKKVHSAHNEKVNSGIRADSYDIESQVLGCNLFSFKSWYRESIIHELGLSLSPRHSV